MTVREEAAAPLERRTAHLTRYDEYAVTIPASGDPALVLVPQGGTPSAAVYYLHGRTADESAIDERADVRDGLLDAGFLVVSPYLHGDLWGNRDAQDALGSVHDWVSCRWPVTRRFLIGESMGATTAANAVRLGEVQWNAAVLIAPSLSMRAVWERGEHGRDTLAAAYRLSADGHDLESKTNAWDAVRHEPDAYAGVPVRVYASPDDVVANIAEVTGPWVRRLRAASMTTELIVVSGEHVSADHFRVGDIVAFFTDRP
ncbi:alpha/beta hydrolase family protein [Rhodococcus tibetensis]|uniref:Lysophospholipase n=1 Tax=Rhodococcus tibetensis TaxID=2965064 RepID=A0ABT1QFF1_9NOCA|nr:alpha/beta hydrolase [Rhodococcus sp. FXJ9.536]MCQ4120917.1 lysophospholipase [Rhodococcus sp. FXJ9.536]